MLQSCSCGSVHKHQLQQPMMAEPLISLSSSKTWLKPPNTQSSALTYTMCPNLILLHPIVSAQPSSSYHLLNLQLLRSHSPRKANLQPGRITRERACWRRGQT